jgi:hypothetical protein
LRAREKKKSRVPLAKSKKRKAQSEIQNDRD